MRHEKASPPKARRNAARREVRQPVVETLATLHRLKANGMLNEANQRKLHSTDDSRDSMRQLLEESIERRRQRAAKLSSG